MALGAGKSGKRVIYLEEWQEEGWTQETRHFGKIVPLALFFFFFAFNGIRVSCHLPAITKMGYERPHNSVVLKRTITHLPSQIGLLAIKGGAKGQFVKLSGEWPPPTLNWLRTFWEIHFSFLVREQGGQSAACACVDPCARTCVSILCSCVHPCFCLCAFVIKLERKYKFSLKWKLFIAEL